MDTHGRLSAEKPLDRNMNVCIRGLEYTRSSSLSSVRVVVPPEKRVSLVVEAEVYSGYLTFIQDSEHEVIKTCRIHLPSSKVITLEKVTNVVDGDSFIPEDKFYPMLIYMLKYEQD